MPFVDYMTKVELWCVLPQNRALVHNGCSNSKPMKIVTLNPLLTGGGGVFNAPLPNIRDSTITNSAIDVKLGRPSNTTI